MKSWKIGALSGLIAGIVAGIIAIIIASILFNIGHLYFSLPSPPTIAPMMHIAIVEFTINIIWGIALGIFYSRIYDLIPGKHVSKGLVYGLILGLILWVRYASFTIIYAPQYVFGGIIAISVQISYGLILAILYEFLESKYYPDRKKLKIVQYDWKGGIHPGAIGGLIGGIVIFFAHALFWDPIDFPKYVTDIGFLLGQFGTHAFINMCWGAVFGILFVVFYERIPRKDALQGFIFGIIIFFITSFRFAIYWLLFGNIGYSISWGNAIFLFIINGLILSLLYKPPK